MAPNVGLKDQSEHEWKKFKLVPSSIRIWWKDLIIEIHTTFIYFYILFNRPRRCQNLILTSGHNPEIEESYVHANTWHAW